MTDTNSKTTADHGDKRDQMGSEDDKTTCLPEDPKTFRDRFSTFTAELPAWHGNQAEAYVFNSLFGGSHGGLGTLFAAGLLASCQEDLAYLCDQLQERTNGPVESLEAHSTHVKSLVEKMDVKASTKPRAKRMDSEADPSTSAEDVEPREEITLDEDEIRAIPNKMDSFIFDCDRHLNGVASLSEQYKQGIVDTQAVQEAVDASADFVSEGKFKAREFLKWASQTDDPQSDRFTEEAMSELDKLTKERYPSLASHWKMI